MKLQHHGEEVEVLGSAPSGKVGFQIKTSALAFKILSEGLYSDKIKAVIRELSTNAFDAMVEAGKRDQPFKVHLPTRYEPWFSVKDEGVGMSHDRILHNYCTYFGSSKNDTNDQVGCLGLGSKSPFAYTETFSVTSIKDGKKRTYTALVSEQGYPEVMEIPLGEEDGQPVFEVNTDEPNGVEVSFPVKESDIYEFHNKARSVYLDFPVKPETNLSDFRIGKIEYTVKKATWRMRKPCNDLSWHTHVRVVQGCVAYPLDHNQIGFRHPLLDSLIDLHVPIGDVEITPSREAISYTEFTRKNLKAALEVVAQEIAESYVEKINTCKTRLEALITMSQIRSQNRELFNAVEKLVYSSSYDNFKLTGDYIDVDQCDYLPIQVSSLQFRGSKLDKGSFFSSKADRLEMINNPSARTIRGPVKFQFSTEPYLIFNDTTKGNLKSYLNRANEAGEFPRAHLFLIEASKDEDGTLDPDAKDYADLLANEFDSKIILMSTLVAKYPAPKREKVDKKTTRIRQFWVNRRDNGSDWWRCSADNIEHLLTQGEGKVKYWVNLFDGKVNEEVVSNDNQVLGELIQNLKAAGFPFHFPTVFGVPERELAVVKDDPDEWVNLMDAAKEYLENLPENEVNLLTVIENMGKFSNLRDLLKLIQIPDLQNSRLVTDATQFKTILDAGAKLQEYYSPARKKAEAIQVLSRQFEIKPRPFPKEIDLYLDHVRRDFPILIDLATRDRSHAVIYVKLIEERDALLAKVAEYESLEAAV